MALTDAQRISVRRHLGIPAPGPTRAWLVDPWISVDNVRDAIPAAAETEVVNVLAFLDATETAMSAALTRLKAAKVGSITLNHEELRDLREERQAWRRELANVTGLPLLHGGG